MTYVCTFSLPDLNWLIRVDVRETLVGASAIFRRTDAQGNEDSYSCPIGPDEYGIGDPTIAVLALIKDLNFAEVSGHIHVAHRGALDQDDLIDILQQLHPAYALRNMTTTETIQ